MKISRTNHRESIVAHLEKRSAERNELIEKLISAEENVDEIDLFFQSIAKQVKKFPSTMQHRAKMETLNLIGNLEFEILNQQPAYHMPSASVPNKFLASDALSPPDQYHLQQL